MDIIYSPNDSLFKADSLEELKEKIVEYLTVRGAKPTVEIRDGLVYVHIDTVVLEDAERNYNKASLLASQGKFEEALEILFDVIRACPHYTEANRTIAQIQLIQNDVDLALDSCIEALRWNPQDVNSLILMGNILSAKGSTESANNYYRKVLKYDPQNIYARINLSAGLINDGAYDEAIEALTPIVDKANVPLNAFYALAMSYMRRNKGSDMRTAYDIILNGLKTAKTDSANPQIRNESISLMKSAAETLAKGDYHYVIDTVIDILGSINGVKVDLSADVDRYKGAWIAGHSKSNRSITVGFNPDFPNYQHDLMQVLLNLKLADDVSKRDTYCIPNISKQQYSLFRKRFGTHLSKSMPGMGRDEFADKVDNICKGIIDGVVGESINLFIETQMFNDYRIMRPVQMLSMFKQELDAITGYQENARNKILPLPLLRAQSVMGMLRAFVLKDLFAVDMANQYRPSKQEYEQAKDLYEEFKAYAGCEPGEIYEFVEYVIDSLGLNEYCSFDPMSSSAIDEDEYQLLDSLLAASDIEYTKEQHESEERFREQHKKSDPMVNMMMAMYMLGAMEYFQNWSTEEVRRTAMEIAVLGTKGLNPDVKSGYKVASMPDKDMGGYQMLAYYYVSWKIAEPAAHPRLGLDMFDEAYSLAKQMYDAKKK